MEVLAHSLQLFEEYDFFLASASPRRAQLLTLIELDFKIIASSINEDNIETKDPVEYVKTLAHAKAKDVAKNLKKGIVIGADTIVVLDDCVIGKPRDFSEAKDMLTQLSGRTHIVYTGFSLIAQPSGKEVTDCEATSVHFRRLSSNEIDYYINTGSPFDKAGAYGIQDISAVFIDRIEGCYYNVVGFPLAKFFVTFRDFANSFVEE